MSPEAQRLAIAEACGWKVSEYGFIRGAYAVVCGDKVRRTEWYNDRLPTLAHLSHYLPDYLTDLNAMNEAERTLDEMDAIKRHDFCHELKRACDTTQIPYILSATAAQRAEAFLRTLNLWDDSK